MRLYSRFRPVTTAHPTIERPSAELVRGLAKWMRKVTALSPKVELDAKTAVMVAQILEEHSSRMGAR